MVPRYHLTECSLLPVTCTYISILVFQNNEQGLVPELRFQAAVLCPCAFHHCFIKWTVSACGSIEICIRFSFVIQNCVNLIKYYSIHFSTHRDFYHNFISCLWISGNNNTNPLPTVLCDVVLNVSLSA